MPASIKRLYFTPHVKGSLAGAATFARPRGLPKSVVQRELDQLMPYNINRPLRRKWPRRRTMAYHIHDLWQIDLKDVNIYKKWNLQKRFLFIVVDVLSRMAWVIPIKDKTADTVLRALKQVVKQAKTTPKNIHSDFGKEIFNKQMKLYVKEKNINLYRTYSGDQKASIVERYIKTLFGRIGRLMRHRKSFKYIDALPAIVSSINGTFNRSIGMAPKEVNKENESDVFRRLYSDLLVKNKLVRRLKVGTFVRIGKDKLLFEKGYVGNYSEEVYRIIDRKRHENIDSYYLTDMKGDKIKGYFARYELVPASPLN